MRLGGLCPHGRELSRAKSIVLLEDGSLELAQLRAGLAQLETVRANILGIVLNRTQDASDETYGYYAPMAEEEEPRRRSGRRRERARR